MLIILNGVIIVSLIGAMLSLLLSHQKTQQALIWWHTKQWSKMYQVGEAIQNGLLQESFVMRRNLELSLVNPTLYQQQQEQDYLATIENFDYSLKELSGYLSPAHIENSLPLAIQHILAEWKLRIPGLNLHMELPSDWHQESLFTSRVILLTLEEILQIALSNHPHLSSIFISLNQRKNFNELIIQLTYSKKSQQTYISNLSELDYLRRIFNLLTLGKCFYDHQNNFDKCYFRWTNHYASVTREK